MKPKAYESFRHRFHQRLCDSQGAAEDKLRLHDAQVKELETSQRNLVQLARQGLGTQSLVEELKQIERDLARMKAGREQIVPPEIELPEDLPELYHEMVSSLAATLSQEDVAGRAADELVDRIVVQRDAGAKGHWLTIEGNLLEMLRKTAPSKLGAVDGKFFRGIWLRE